VKSFRGKGAGDDVISLFEASITDWPRPETDCWTDEESTSMAFFISM
jgi:hypothetical protein